MTAGETPAFGHFLPETASAGEQLTADGVRALVHPRHCQLQDATVWIKQKGPACFGGDDMGSRHMPTDWELEESGAGTLFCIGTECSLRLEVPRDVICMASPSVWVFFCKICSLEE